MTEDLDIFEDIVERVMAGTYEGKVADRLFLKKCNELREDAEIYAAVYPDKSGSYLLQRKLIVYRIISKISTDSSDLSRLTKKQRNKLEFIENGLLGLFWLYMELLVDIKE